MADALLDVGVHVVPVSATHAVLRTVVAGRRVESVARIVSGRKGATPTGLKALAGAESVVVIAPGFSKAARAVIDANQWSWIAAPSGGAAVSGSLILPGCDPISIGHRARSAPRVLRTRGRTAWGRIAVIRQLLHGGSWSQTALASAAGLSQPRVSQILAELVNAAHVVRLREPTEPYPRWTVADFDGLLRLWLDSYPGPGGITSHWYHLGSLSEQTQIALDELARTTPDTASNAPVASADAAADHIAPYRRPVISIVYSRWTGDLERAGFVPASPRAATLQLVIPEDVSIWTTPDDWTRVHLAPSSPAPLADPTQVVWDLLHGPALDADQAAEAVIEVLARHASGAVEVP